MKKILTINTGNTNTVVGLFVDRRLKKKWKRSSTPLSLRSLIGKLPHVDVILISSVVPSLKKSLLQLTRPLSQKNPLFVNPRLKMSIRFRLKNPTRVGQDRIANVVAAYARHKRGAIVVDVGTATTLDVVNAKGEFLGGLIAPGRTLLAEALHQKCALLPNVSIEKPKHFVGRNTSEAIQSAVYWGYAELIDGLIRRLRSQVGNLPVITTGGLAPLLRPSSRYIRKIYSDLTLEGLRLLAEWNS